MQYRRPATPRSLHVDLLHSPFVINGIAAYERAFKMLEGTFAETGPWIVDANVSLAEINLMPFAARRPRRV